MDKFLFIDRRVIYDFEKFGDSPACIGTDGNIENQIALTQGFGITENTVDTTEERELLETNVTIISNDECYNKLEMAESSTLKATARNAMPNGVTDQMLCTLCIVKEIGEKTICSVSVVFCYYFNHTSYITAQLKILKVLLEMQ